jgi:hypothetical protein
MPSGTGECRRVSSSPLSALGALAAPDRHQPTASVMGRHPLARRGMSRHRPAGSDTARTQPDDPGFVVGSWPWGSVIVARNGTVRPVPAANSIRWHGLASSGIPRDRGPVPYGGRSECAWVAVGAHRDALQSLQLDHCQDPHPASRRADADRRGHRGESAQRRAVGRWTCQHHERQAYCGWRRGHPTTASLDAA